MKKLINWFKSIWGKIFKKNEIEKRLDEKIKIATHDYELYDHYHCHDKAYIAKQIFDTLMYIKTGEKK